jgi:Holliday junction resolvase
MTPEGKVKKRVNKILEKYGAYYFSPVTGGFGRSGVPDIIVCYLGVFIGIECKAGDNKPTALQLKNLEDIHTNGGWGMIVNEETVEDVEAVLVYIEHLREKMK